ncbi:hypothetical protein ACFLX5_06135, partial [Chloroflexota bacterium]
MRIPKILFSPIKIGTMQLRNRIVLAPMSTDFPAPDGTVTEELISYHRAQ